jgi:hypothetical protein
MRILRNFSVYISGNAQYAANNDMINCMANARWVFFRMVRNVEFCDSYLLTVLMFPPEPCQYCKPREIRS